jgi:hypothetical protein
MQWLTAGTVALLSLGAIAFPLLSWGDRSKLGDFLGGFAAAVAFLWLVASVRFQSRELALQRSELQLQRAALDRQVEELSNSAKFSSLAQISEILDRASRALSESPAKIHQPSEAMGALTGGLKHWKPLLESTDPNEVQAHWSEWMKIEGAIRAYLSGVAFALKIYLEFNARVPFDSTSSNELFIMTHRIHMTGAPFLAEHAGSAVLVAEIMSSFEPGLKAIQLAGMVSAEKAFGRGVFKDGALDEMKRELAAKGRLPAIAQK